jgi:toxin ParE1/3/4
LSRRVSLSRAAEDDLDGHFLFLAEDSIETAMRFFAAAQRALDRIESLPEIGPRRGSSNPRLTNIRVWPIPGFPNHLIYYVTREDGLLVLRVLHAKRESDPLLRAGE